LIENCRHLWDHVHQVGAHYGVNPLVFAVLYLAHHPLFWGTMAWLTVCVRRKQSVAVPITLGVFFWFLPYAYVFLFGRGLPWWAWVIACVVVGVGGTHMVREIRRRLTALRVP
jgi:hypothetical protein